MKRADVVVSCRVHRVSRSHHVSRRDLVSRPDRGFDATPDTAISAPHRDP